MAKKRFKVQDERIDFLVRDEGTIFLLRPRTDAANAWVEEHLPEDRQLFGFSIVVEHRYINDIILGIQNDGLVVKGSSYV